MVGLLSLVCEQFFLRLNAYILSHTHKCFWMWFFNGIGNNNLFKSSWKLSEKHLWWSPTLSGIQDCLHGTLQKSGLCQRCISKFIQLLKCCILYFVLYCIILYNIISCIILELHLSVIFDMKKIFACFRKMNVVVDDSHTFS